MQNDLTAQRLRNSGLHLTRQRKLVLAVLEESHEHLDAEMIYQRAKGRDPRISLATVYRTLAALKEAGLVVEHLLGEDHGHFETLPSQPHYHFSCLKCGRVVEFESPEVMQAARRLCQGEGLQIVEVHLHLSGYCAQCRSAEAGCE